MGAALRAAGAVTVVLLLTWVSFVTLNANLTDEAVLVFPAKANTSSTAPAPDLAADVQPFPSASAEPPPRPGSSDPPQPTPQPPTAVVTSTPTSADQSTTATPPPALNVSFLVDHLSASDPAASVVVTPTPLPSRPHIPQSGTNDTGKGPARLSEAALDFVHIVNVFPSRSSGQRQEHALVLYSLWLAQSRAAQAGIRVELQLVCFANEYDQVLAEVRPFGLNVSQQFLNFSLQAVLPEAPPFAFLDQILGLLPGSSPEPADVQSAIGFAASPATAYAVPPYRWAIFSNYDIIFRDDFYIRVLESLLDEKLWDGSTEEQRIMNVHRLTYPNEMSHLWRPAARPQARRFASGEASSWNASTAAAHQILWASKFTDEAHGWDTFVFHRVLAAPLRSRLRGLVNGLPGWDPVAWGTLCELTPRFMKLPDGKLGGPAVHIGHPKVWAKAPLTYRLWNMVMMGMQNTKNPILGRLRPREQCRFNRKALRTDLGMCEYLPRASFLTASRLSVGVLGEMESSWLRDCFVHGPAYDDPKYDSRRRSE